MRTPSRCVGAISQTRSSARSQTECPTGPGMSSLDHPHEVGARLQVEMWLQRLDVLTRPWPGLRRQKLCPQAPQSPGVGGQFVRGQVASQACPAGPWGRLVPVQHPSPQLPACTCVWRPCHKDLIFTAYIAMAPFPNKAMF